MTSLPPLPEPMGVIVVRTQARRAFTAEQMVDYAAAVRAAALEEAANLVELEYAKDHAGVLRLKQIAGHIRALISSPAR